MVLLRSIRRFIRFIIAVRIKGGFIVSYPDLSGCITCSDTIEGAISNALDAKRAWLTAAIEDGADIPEPSVDKDLEDYSGQFKIRLPKSLHQALSIHAKQEGISMNQYCLYLLAKYNELYSVRHMQQSR